MNRDMGEEEIGALFREMKRSDGAGAPSFEALLERVSVPGAKPRGLPRRQILACATATGVLIVAGFALVGLLDREDGPAAPAADRSISLGPEPKLVRPSPSFIPRKSIEAPRLPRKVARKRARPTGPVVAEWRSPTDFLLRTPGDELLRTVPRVGDSLSALNRIIGEEPEPRKE